MVRIEVSHTLPVSVAEALACITDMKNRPEYWPAFVRIEDPAAARRGNPGDKAAATGLAGHFDRLLVRRSVEQGHAKDGAESR